MFTGLIEEMGRIARLEPRPGGRRMWISAVRALEGAASGDSVSVNGCCLTLIAIEPGAFAVEAVPETLARTTLGALEEGEPVNLERAMRLDQRLGGHLVQGHVDGVGEVTRVEVEGEGRRVTFGMHDRLLRFVAEKGSIAVDGVSLTVAGMGRHGCEIAYIPHTLAATVAGRYGPGTRVNLEVDLIARYLARLIDADGHGKGTR
jgi:riboflavin synthase